MSRYATIQGRRFAIAAGRFNEVISQRLVDGALATLARHGFGQEAVDVIWVPGAFELPLASVWLADTGRYGAILALGAVIRGGTDHYEHVCTQAARGLLEAGLRTGVPVVFGVLTCETLPQALERAGGAAGDKGADAALAGLDMALLRSQLA